ncbi:MAG: YjbF family lipoprotein [Tateyamaria sp.]
MTFRPLVVALCMGLASCTGGTDQIASTTTQVSQIATLVLAQRSAPELPTVNRALLDTLTLASLEITIEDRDALAYLIPAGARRDPFHGPLTVWRTGDNAQVAMRSGVIVGTKGLGNDLQGSDMRGTVQHVEGRDPSEWIGAMTVLTPSSAAQTLALDCVSQKPERKTLEIIELTYTVDHLRETCFIDGNTRFVVNEYWVDVRDRTVWQSRQWISPSIGYVRTRFLKKI